MSEEYKGLTIRIGADTTELKAALRSADGAIRATQKNLNALARAAALDPTGLKLAGRQMETVGAKAEAVAQKVFMINRALSQAPKSLVAVANATADAELKARNATDAYAAAVRRIRELKNAVSERAGEADFDWGSVNGVEETIRKMRELGATMEEIRRYKDELVPDYFQKDEANTMAKRVLETRSYIDQLEMAKVELKSLYMEEMRLASSNPAIMQTREFTLLAEKIDDTDRAASSLTAQLERAERALQLDPASVGAAAAKMAILQDEARLTAKRIELLDAQMKEVGRGGIDAAAAQMTDLAEKTAKAESRAASLEAELSDVRNDISSMRATGVDEAGEEFRRAAAEADRLEAEAREARAELDRLGQIGAFRRLSADMDESRAKLAALGDQLTTLPSKYSRIGGAMQQLGWATYSTLTPAITMAGYAAISAAESVDAAYRNMRKTVQGTEEQFESLKRAAIEYSRTHVTSADQLLEIQAMGGQLGVATSRLEAFSHTVSNLDIATNLEAEDAATQLGQLAGILEDMSQNDFARYGDALVRLGNNNATLEDRIQDVMLRIASMGTIIGFSTPELLAWSTAIAATGQGAEAAGTAISNTMSDIESAVGAGGDKLAAFAEVAGMTAEAFKAAWESDPSSAMQAFVTGLKGIEEAGGSADGTLQELGITGVRQKQAILGLMQTIDGLSSNLTMSNDAWNGVGDAWGAAGDAAREADRKAEGFSGAIQLLRNNAQALAVEFGESMPPQIEALGSAVEWLTGAYAGLPGPVKDVLNVMLLAAAAFGPVSVAVNAVVQAHGSLKDAMEKGHGAWRKQVEAAKAANIAVLAASTETGRLTEKQKLAAGASAALSTALKKIAPFAVIMAIGAVVGKLAEVAVKALESRDAADAMADAVSKIGGDTQALDGAAESVRSFDEIAGDAVDSLATHAEKTSEAWESVGADIAVVEKCISTIERLGEKSGLTAEEQTELVTAVNTLNGVMGTSYKVIDVTNGKLDDGVDSVKAYADAWAEAARSQAASEMLIDVEKQIIDAEKAVAELEGKASELSFSPVAGSPTAGSFGDGREYRLEQLRRGLDELYEERERYTQIIADGTAATDADTEALDANAQAMSANAEAVQEYVSGNDGFADILASSGTSAEELAARLDASGMSFDDFCTKMDSVADAAHDMLDRIDTDAGISYADALANLEHNAEVVSQWGDNLAILYASAGDDATRQFISHLEAMGPEQATLVAELAADPTLMQPLVDAFTKGSQAAVKASSAELVKLPENVSKASIEAQNKAREAVEQFEADGKAAAEKFDASISGSLDNVVAKMPLYGSMIPSGLSSAIDDGKPDFLDTVGVLVEEMSSPILTVARSAYDWGWDLVDSLSGGISEAKRILLTPAISSVAGLISSYIHHSTPDVGPLADDDTYMPDMMRMFAEGIDDNLPAFRSKVEQIPRAIADVLASGSSPTADIAIGLSASGALSPTVNVQVSPVVKVDGGSSYSIGGVTLNEGTPEADAVRMVTDFALKARMANRR